MDAELVARGRAYDLLADLFEFGPDRRRAHLELVDALAPHLPPQGDDDAAAHAYDLFYVQVMPYASAMLEPSRSLGGDVTQQVWDSLRAIGVEPRLEADHLVTHLRALTRLWDQPERAQTFLVERVFPWIPPLAVAVSDADTGLYSAAMDLLVAALEDQLDGAPAPLVLPDPDLDLDRGRTGLKDIARFLATPARCGFWITPKTLARLGRELELPRGFGNRERTLENLLHAAAHRSQVPALLGALGQVVDDTQLQLAARVGGVAWADRTAWTRAQLMHMEQAVVAD